ncbi:MAG: hypothetical protein N2053_13280, partial [Chitinispirillaceae bacterium]|nr:hypothetical protein [Chitinispirillaceae bacterium]
QHHYPIGFKEFVKKIWLENRWITTCQTLPYNNQRALQEIEFFVREENNKSMLIGTYRDSDKFGARYQIILTDFSKESLNWAAEYLNRHYSGV